MLQTNETLIERMLLVSSEWEDCRDGRCVFLRCYWVMTGKMLGYTAADKFQDPQWVAELVHRFAGYYFDALDKYERGSDDVPLVWKRTHDLARSSATTVIEDFLLGLNAHINYDLPLALSDMLIPVWHDLTARELQMHYEDFTLVNEIIADLTDQTQEELADRYARVLDVLDTMGGRLDEWHTNRYIRAWRDDVWRNTISLIDASDTLTREEMRRQIDEYALKRAELMFLGDKLRVRAFGYPVRWLRRMKLL